VDARKDRIVAYYDALAPNYDADRFGTGYGHFIDRQERSLLKAWLPPDGPTLDLGCGTGRLSNFASHGSDGSPASLAIAQAKHPGKAFAVADIAALPYPDASFTALFCLHVGMHLDSAKLAALFGEAARVLHPGGLFVFDIASSTRRAMVRRPLSGWHGDTSRTRGQLATLGSHAGLTLTGTHGIAIAPIHRLPSWLLPALLPFDTLLCGLAPSLASYIVARFRKAPA
jgi:SAM-dependent methyltransferase